MYGPQRRQPVWSSWISWTRWCSGVGITIPQLTAKTPRTPRKAGERSDDMRCLVPDNALDAVSENGRVEVDEQTQEELGRFQVGNHLRGVYRRQLVHGLEFDDKTFLNQKVQEAFTDRLALVGQTDRILRRRRNVAQAKLDLQRFLIRTFKKARPQMAVYLNGCPNDRMSQAIQFHRRLFLGVLGVLAVQLLLSAQPIHRRRHAAGKTEY